MKFGAYLGNQAHAPANSRTALLSAYTGGSTLLSFAVRLSGDGRLVLAQADDAEAATGQAARISQTPLAELRRLDFSERFTPRGLAEGDFNYFDPLVTGRRFGLDALDDIAAELPREVDWLVEVRGGAGAATAAFLAGREALRHTILAFETVAEAQDVKRRHPGARTALIAGDRPPPADGGGCDLLLMSMQRARSQDGWSAEAQAFAGREGGAFPLGACLINVGTAPDAALLAAAASAGWVWAVCSPSTDDFASLRPSYVHVEESFAGQTVDRHRFALGYAKANRFASVTWNDGVHVDIAPYDGPLPAHEGSPLERRVSNLEWDVINVAREWPFYSGGGVGLTLGIADDFRAEVTYAVEHVGQATTLEMAFVNVDPGAHRGEPPASFRDKDSFYDPHGAPPFVGVEHDEDDGFRINWNLGVEYDNNQYGRPVGDGRAPRGARMRLERRGAYFAAYYRDPVGADGAPLQPRTWICVGVARNDSLNRTLFLRCVGKRWRQEKADNPREHEPIIANRFSFRDLRVQCFPTVGD